MRPGEWKNQSPRDLTLEVARAFSFGGRMEATRARPINRVKIYSEFRNPFALNLLGNPNKRFVTVSPLRYIIGGYELPIPMGYEFDGPSIPRPLWWIAGLSPADIDTAPASCAHDYICEHPELLPRIMGDGLFFTVLGGAALNGEDLPAVEESRREAMYLAVRFYSRLIGNKDFN